MIRPHPELRNQWQLLLLLPTGENKVLGVFAMPHLAAQSVAEFRTGDLNWDSIPKVRPSLAKQFGSHSIHDLKKWRRHES